MGELGEIHTSVYRDEVTEGITSMASEASQSRSLPAPGSLPGNEEAEGSGEVEQLHARLEGGLSLAAGDEDEYHEMEVDIEHEATLPTRYLTCEKNPGHKNFIPVSEFSLSHLPVSYQEPILVELIREQAKLAVRLKVKGASDGRPLIAPGTTNVPYPFSSWRYRRALRWGSGWIEHIRTHTEAQNTPCPCSQCQRSGEPRKVWTTVGVATAAHVVYDMTEARKCTCQLFFDTEDADLETCPRLTEAIQVKVQPIGDSCHISYAVHDDKLGKTLDGVLEHCQTLRRAVRDKFRPKVEDDTSLDLPRKIDNLYERCTRLCSAFGEQREQLKAIAEGDPHQQWQDYCAGRENAVHNIDSIGLCLWDRMEGANRRLTDKLLTNISSMHDQSGRLVKQAEKLKRMCEICSDSREEQSKIISLHDSILEFVTALERQPPYSTVYTDSIEDQSTGVFPTEPVYDPLHPLTIIVSHPHGCSKKITVGQVLERGSRWHAINTNYKYDNPTCPGSSGAQVYILGRAGAFVDPAHSGSLGRACANAQVNKSVMQQDV